MEMIGQNFCSTAIPHDSLIIYEEQVTVAEFKAKPNVVAFKGLYLGTGKVPHVIWDFVNPRCCK